MYLAYSGIGLTPIRQEQKHELATEILRFVSTESNPVALATNIFTAARIHLTNKIYKKVCLDITHVNPQERQRTNIR